MYYAFRWVYKVLPTAGTDIVSIHTAGRSFILELMSDILKGFSLKGWEDALFHSLENLEDVDALAKDAAYDEISDTIRDLIQRIGDAPVLGVNLDFSLELDEYLVHSIPIDILVGTDPIHIIEVAPVITGDLPKQISTILAYAGSKLYDVAYTRIKLMGSHVDRVSSFPYSYKKVRPIIKKICQGIHTGIIYPTGYGCRTCPYIKVCDPEFASVRKLRKRRMIAPSIRAALGDTNGNIC